ncbi:MAG: ABC transporter permease [Acidobacteriota bacterium]
MRGMLAIARHDLRQTLANRAALLWLFVFPVLFAAFFGLVFSENDRPAQARARLTVVDEDSGPLARLLVRELEGAGLEVVELAPDEAAAAQDRIRTLTIPQEFGRRIVAGEQVTLRLETDPGTSDEAALAVQARILASIARVIGSLVEQKQAAGDAPLDETRFAGYESPPDLVTIESSFAGQAAVVPSGFAHSAPGNAVMFVLLITLTWGAASLAAERMHGMLRRLGSAPVTAAEIVGGKIAGRFLVSLTQIVVLLLTAVAAVALFDLPLSGDPLAVLAVLVVYGLAVAPLGVLLGAAIREPSRAANVGVLVSLVLAALGGCWWPIEVVPPWLQAVARALPTGWAMIALHRLISFGGGFADTLPWLAALLAFGTAVAALARRTLRIA